MKYNQTLLIQMLLHFWFAFYALHNQASTFRICDVAYVFIITVLNTSTTFALHMISVVCQFNPQIHTRNHYFKALTTASVFALTSIYLLPNSNLKFLLGTLTGINICSTRQRHNRGTQIIKICNQAVTLCCGYLYWRTLRFYQTWQDWRNIRPAYATILDEALCMLCTFLAGTFTLRKAAACLKHCQQRYVRPQNRRARKAWLTPYNQPKYKERTININHSSRQEKAHA